MRTRVDEALSQATRSNAPAIVSPPPTKLIRKKAAQHPRFFFGNKAFEQFRRIRDIGERMNVWWQHHEPDFDYRQQYEQRRHRGKHKDDWAVDYRAWSPTKGMSVEIEWLHDVKSSRSVKCML